jgi:uncharacterized membrane protein YkoI
MNTRNEIRGAHHIYTALKTLTIALVLLACFSAPGAEGDEGTLLAKLKESKHSLAESLRQSEMKNGVAISAKFELEDGKLMLSVYTAKGGLSKDPEHSELIELKGEASTEAWTPEIEVFEDKKHLTRSAMQLSLVQLSSLTLLEVIKKAETAQPGTVYSVIPSIKEKKPIFDVKVATDNGKSVHLTIDAKTGAAGK